jgi:hypothetical protein
MEAVTVIGKSGGIRSNELLQNFIKYFKIKENKTTPPWR